MGIKPIEEAKFGLYVWQFKGDDGQSYWASDGEGNIMQIASVKGDLQKQKILTEAAKHYGFPPGEPVFLSGRRGISDEEYEYQIQRAAWGLTPDPLDVGVYKEDIRHDKNRG